MPTGMADKGEEIQMALSHVDAALQRANAIAHGIVIVDVAKQLGVGCAHIDAFCGFLPNK